MKYNVGIQGIEDTNRGANFNLQVDAPNVIMAMDSAKAELLKVLEASGLSLKPVLEVAPPSV